MFKLIEILTSIAGWCKIVASPFLLTSGIGAYIYLRDPGPYTLVVGTLLSVIGLLTGILWATRVWKKTDSITFLSRISASPELDKPQKNAKKSKTNRLPVFHRIV